MNETPPPSALDRFLDAIVPGRLHIRVLKERMTRLEKRLDRSEAIYDGRLATVSLNLREEALRIDYALGAIDGMPGKIEEFHQARATPEYQAAFTTANPLVSVCVTTAFRPDLLINRCIASLQEQTYKNLQIIVVGDHCIDDTPSRMSALKDDRIIFFNLPERGPYPLPGKDRWHSSGTNAVNKAVSLCEGPFITHLDDDDRFEPDRIEILVRAAQEQKADFCYHPFQFEAADGGWMTIGDGTFEHRQLTTSSIFYHRYFTRFPWNIFGYRYHEPCDWHWLRKIAMLRPRMHFVNKPLAHHYYGSHRETFVAREGERFLD